MQVNETVEHAGAGSKPVAPTWTDESLPLPVRRSLLKRELEKYAGKRAEVSSSQPAEPAESHPR